MAPSRWFREPSNARPPRIRLGSLLALAGVVLMLSAGLASSAQACDAEASRTLNGNPFIPVVSNPNKMAAIAEAGIIADIGHYAAREMLARAHHENITEQQVIDVIEAAMVEAGAQEPSFATIVASGEDSAIPHGDYDDDDTNLVLPGEVVVIDLGARVDGWASDETRTYVLEPVPENFTEVYTIVLEAHDLSAPYLVHMTEAWRIDKVARDHIRDNGYGQYFTHGLGHGVGLCVHERPLLSQRNGSSFGMDYDANRDIASVADVVTIEPGIYLPGLWGIRIEDDYQVYDDHSEARTFSPTNLTFATVSPDEWDPDTQTYDPHFEKPPIPDPPVDPSSSDDDDDKIPWGGIAIGLILLPIIAVGGYKAYHGKGKGADKGEGREE